jgi:putative transposase
MSDTLGLPWSIEVTAANTSDKAGFQRLFSHVIGLDLLILLIKVFADRGYRGLEEWLAEVSEGSVSIEIVGALAGERGFVVQPKRWIVERTWSWFGWSRRLSKDYEQTRGSSIAWLEWSAIRLALRKLDR